jgi:hypothetical protein
MSLSHDYNEHGRHIQLFNTVEKLVLSSSWQELG